MQSENTSKKPVSFVSIKATQIKTSIELCARDILDFNFDTNIVKVIAKNRKLDQFLQQATRVA